MRHSILIGRFHWNIKSTIQCQRGRHGSWARCAAYLIWGLSVAALPASGQCNALPPVDPAKSFRENFLNPCYAIRLASSLGGGSGLNGDLNATYNRIYYRVNSAYELIIFGVFPRARYMSVTPYDDHFATAGWLDDAAIVPLLPAYINPFRPGVSFVEDQLYGVAIQFGGKQPQSVNPGCGFAPDVIYANSLDATKRHSGITWNGSSNLPAGFPIHDDLGPSKAGVLSIRQYLRASDTSTLHLYTPQVIARSLSTGCAVPAQQVLLQLNQTQTDSKILTLDQNVATTWMGNEQVSAHIWYDQNYKKKLCYPPDPSNVLVWFGNDEYIETSNPDSRYLSAVVSPINSFWLVATRRFLRMRFRLPTVPRIPCTGCSITGTEQLRYWSVSLTDSNANTLASIDDRTLVTDPNGYVSLIIGFGSQPPAYVNASNYYTYFDFSQTPNFSQLHSIEIRTILPDASFLCSAKAVPFYTMEYNSLGGYMGEYAPVADIISGAQMPQRATPLQVATFCGVAPPQPPAVCSTH